MSVEEHFAGPAIAAAGGAAVGKVVVARSGMHAIGMLGVRGAGWGAPAGPVWMAVGALGGLAVYAVLRAVGDAAEEYAGALVVQNQQQAAVLTGDAADWAAEWAEEKVVVTGNHEEDRISVGDLVASFDAWLQEMFDDQRPQGWAIWTSRAAALRQLKVDPNLTPASTLLGVRLRDGDDPVTVRME
jgi:hypothetical protein